MFITPAYAQSADAAAQGGGSGGMLMFVGQIALLIAAFYFLMLRPQQRRQKEHQASINALKKGDSVVTAGGLVGKVVKVDDKFVELEIAKGVNVRAVKSTLAEVMTAGGAKPAND